MFQICTAIYLSLKAGDLGVCPPADLESYRARCHDIFPIATIFTPEIPNGIAEKPNVVDLDNGVEENPEIVSTVTGASEISDGIAA